MALSHEELDRLTDDTFGKGVIKGTVYCGNCGYNLHSLPFIYTCPECGNQYNARRLTRKGIFSPEDMIFPLADTLLTLLASVITVGAAWRTLAPNPPSYVWLFAGVAFGSVTLAFGWRTYGKLARYLKNRAIARCIATEENH